MNKSKIGMILAILDAGGHVMGDRASYYDAKAIRDGLRAHDSLTRAKKITKKYRVRVEECLTGSGKLIISTFDRAQSITV